jgi:hypothetical protein
MDQFADAGEGKGGAHAGGKRKLEEENGGQFDLQLAKEWAEVPRVGDIVKGSPFIPCKRPLSPEANEKVDEAERYFLVTISFVEIHS